MAHFEAQDSPVAGNEINRTRKQLGLKLVPKTAPIQVLVIDQIELPSPN